LLGLTKNTAASYGKSGICCNIVLAGFMETNISTSFTGGINQAGIERIQMLMASVEADAYNLEQMGERCAYLCSEGARVLNDAEIVADNGWSSY
jgi:NAD(P)-dependent dehydrogenase (short-subunit alcohol dehydrogenase family)